MTFVRKKERLIMITFSGVIAFATGIDIFFDLQENVPFEHLVHELGLLGLALAAGIYQLRLVLNKDHIIADFASQIRNLEFEQAQFKERFSKLKSDFSHVVDQQFSDWKLSTGEREIALLLVKGVSMREIADTRQTSEGTVRQQATVIYKKSNLSGRQELAAFFLDELFSFEQN
jgi:DNA-binding CsgD family transcriptional regulator